MLLLLPGEDAKKEKFNQSDMQEEQDKLQQSQSPHVDASRMLF